jgi:hypothetical protein
MKAGLTAAIFFCSLPLAQEWKIIYCLPTYKMHFSVFPKPMQTYEYKHQRDIFDSKARAWTRQHAVQMKLGEVGAEAVVDAAPSTAAVSQQQKQQQKLEILEDEQAINPTNSTVKHAIDSASGKMPVDAAVVDINKENPEGSGVGGGARKQKVEEIEKRSLDKANLQAEQDTQGITTSIAGAEPPQKKSKLSLHRN